MKIRAKLGARRELITLNSCNDQYTLIHLKDAIKEKFLFTSDTEVEVTLNGKDALQGDDATLADLGIVSGDLVILKTPSNPNAPQNQPSNELPLPAVPREATKGNDVPTSESQPPSSSGVSNKHKTDNVDHEQREIDDNDVDKTIILDPEVNRYLSEPMLCRDSNQEQVPLRLVRLYEDASAQNVSDAVTVVLHLLMLETGFLVSSDASSCSSRTDHSDKMPSNWKTAGAYRFIYCHNNSPNVAFKMICVTLGRMMIIHGYAELPDASDCSLQLQINSSDYVVGVRQNANNVYKNLSKLSQIFKDKISYRLMEDSRQLLNLPQLSGFSGLFPELKFAVLKYLDFKSLVRMSGTCRELKSIAKDPSLWRRLYLLKFGKRADQTLTQEWLQYYKDVYRRRKEQEEMIHRPVFMPGQPPYPQGIFGPPLPYAPGAPSGIIGGGYDIDPFGFHGNMLPRPLRPFRPQRPYFPGLPGNRPNRPSRGRGGFGGIGPTFPPFY